MPAWLVACSSCTSCTSGSSCSAPTPSLSLFSSAPSSNTEGIVTRNWIMAAGWFTWFNNNVVASTRRSCQSNPPAPSLIVSMATDSYDVPNKEIQRDTKKYKEIQRNTKTQRNTTIQRGQQRDIDECTGLPRGVVCCWCVRYYYQQVTLRAHAFDRRRGDKPTGRRQVHAVLAKRGVHQPSRLLQM